MTEKKYLVQFQEVLKLSIEEQATVFLRAFVLEFIGKFQDIFDICDDFKKYAPKEGVVRELDEVAAHHFLQKRDEAITATLLREYMKDIDLNKDRNVSFIEYLLWTYKKSLAQLFNPVPVPPEVLAELEKALAQYKAAMAVRKEREDKMAALEAIVAQGGVKGLTARHQLEAMQDQINKLDDNVREIKAEVNKKKAQKVLAREEALANSKRDAQLKLEEERVAREKKEKEDLEKKKKEEARARLQAKAAAFQN